MRSLSLARIELRRLLTGQPIVAAAVLVILVVPLLYGALYLWAFWDPYGRIGSVPVAVVNQDVAVRSGDTTVSAGADLVGELDRTGTMGWRAMSASEASSALREHRVYLVLSIPRDFSAALASAETSHPVRARLEVTANEADNMLVGQIGARVFSEVRAAASARASRTYFETVFTGLADVRRGMAEAADGAASLRAGLAKADGGADTLANGLGVAYSGASGLTGGLERLSAGASDVRDGAGTVARGATTLASRLRGGGDGASRLDDGARRLAGGLDSLTTGLDTLAANSADLDAASKQVAGGAAQTETGVRDAVDRLGDAASASDELRNGADRVAAALQSYLQAHPEAADDPALLSASEAARSLSSGLGELGSHLSGAESDGRRLLAGATQVSGGAARLADGVGDYTAGVVAAAHGATQARTGARSVAEGASGLNGGISRAVSGANELAAGTSRLAAGATRLSDGARDAAGGSRALTAGVGRLSAGAEALSGGLAVASAGSSRLANGLTAGVDELPRDGIAARSMKASMMSDPVALKTVKRTTVANYGTGFAPYFIPLALWVGALMTFFLVRPVPGRALASNASDIVVSLSGFWPAALLGALQAVIMLAVVVAGLGLDPALPAMTLGLTVLTAATFVALIQWLSAALGPAGKLAAIVLLMLQLTSAAGTFPIETVPPFFRAIHPYLPMTYVVEGLRQTLAGGDAAVVVRCALTLLAFLALGLTGTLLAVRRQRVWTMDRLRPAITI